MTPPRIVSRASNATHLAPRLAADEQEFHQDDGQKDRERIVEAGFDLQRRADARPQPQSLGMEQEEDGGGIGRGDHRAHQQRLGPAETEGQHRRRSGERRGHDDADASPAYPPAPITLRNVWKRVRNPPSKRMRPSATDPTV